MTFVNRSVLFKTNRDPKRELIDDNSSLIQIFTLSTRVYWDKFVPIKINVHQLHCSSLMTNEPFTKGIRRVVGSKL